MSIQLLFGALVGIALVAGHALPGAAASKPNIILILADDLSADELGSYGNTEHRTPQLDRMAAEGLRLDTFYATPMCTPTRVSLMTGQYGFHNGYLSMKNKAFKPAPGSPQYEVCGQLTFADLMKSAGYATALAGKWQLPGNLPTLIRDCGFDEYRMWAYQSNLPAGVEHTGRWEGEPGKSRTARYWHPSLVENGEYLPTTVDDYGPDLFMDFIESFIQRHKQQPFFIYHPTPMTHGPHEETPDPQHPGQRWPLGFESNLEYLDHLMGRLLRVLAEQGVSRNTVVLFVGDNGSGGSGKGTVSERGVRVPFIVWGPGVIEPAPGSERALGDLTDVLPTLAELAGVDLPRDQPFDGHSLMPLLRGVTTKHRDWIYSFLDDGRILRDDRWLLEIPGGGKPERLFDCGEHRDGNGYQDASGVDTAAANAARERFAKILSDMPVPKPRPGDSAQKRGTRTFSE